MAPSPCRLAGIRITYKLGTIDIGRVTGNNWVQRELVFQPNEGIDRVVFRQNT
jgi:hypothetical protein